jgi:alpha-galactosidase
MPSSAKDWLGPKTTDENYAVSWLCGGLRIGRNASANDLHYPEAERNEHSLATLDDRWFDNYGDWQPRADTFPGDAIKKMVDDFHAQGIKVQIWWLPLGVEDRRNSFGARNFVVPDVLKEHPDWLVLDKNGKPARMARNLATLCPALPEVQGLPQATDREVCPRLGIRWPQTRQYLQCSAVLQPQASPQVTYGLNLTQWAKFTKSFFRLRAG